MRRYRVTCQVFQKESIKRADERAEAERQEKEKMRYQLLRLARELQRMRDAETARKEAEADALRLEFIAREER